MKIVGYTCAYNEEKMIPYVMPYVEAFGYDKFVVYDNKSTDNTVEMLKKYPFVEVREYDTNGKFDDTKKCDLQKASYREAISLAKIGTKEEELVWFTWTDFDEVMFINSDCDFRDILEGDYRVRGYNCYDKNMINLLPPVGKEDVSPSEYLREGQMFHTYQGVRGNIWVGGGKPIMMAVNAFKELHFFGGNHYGLVRMRDNRVLKPYNDMCRIYSAHLKFIDKNILIEKWKEYMKRGLERYSKDLENIDKIYERQIGVSFPISDYFLMDYFNSALNNRTCLFNGLQLIR